MDHGPILTPPLEAPPFEPHPLLRNRHAMTVVGGLPRRAPDGLVRTERAVAFPVEPEVELSALANDLPDPESRATVLVVHGLTGDARTGYATGTASKALAAGLNAVRLNLRGCGDSEEASPEIYHAGVSGDLEQVLRRLKERGRERVYVVGFSLGGNVALKLAGELGSAAAELTAGIVAVSPPIDLADCCDSLNEGTMNRVYQALFLRDLRRRVRRKHALHPDRIPVEGLDEMRTLREFDDRFTAPLSGYGDADNYYARASALPVLDGVRVPTLVLHARDDPFVPYARFEEAPFETNPALRLLAPEHGGHLGFVAGRRGRDPDRQWAESRAVQFVRALEAARAAPTDLRPS